MPTIPVQKLVNSAVPPSPRPLYSKPVHVESQYGSLPHIKAPLLEVKTRSTDSRKNSAREWSKERKKHNLWVIRPPYQSNIFPSKSLSCSSSSPLIPFPNDDWYRSTHTPLRNILAVLFSRNILLQRQFLSTAAVSSMESNNSTDDSDQRFSNSFDSTRSELERRRLSLMNQQDAGSSDEACGGSTQRINTRDYRWVRSVL